MDREVFGRKLRRMRLDRGTTTQALADAAGIARSSVNRYESGSATPKAATVARLARALKVDPCELMGGSKRRKRETAHDREVFKLLNVAQSLNTARLTMLTAFARFLYTQQRRTNDHT